MYISTILISLLLSSLPTSSSTSIPSQQPLQRPISFPSPSHHPIQFSEPKRHPLACIKGTLEVTTLPYGLLTSPVHVTYSHSPYTCMVLRQNHYFLPSSFTSQILLGNPSGVAFPFSADSQYSHSAVSLAVNITEQIGAHRFLVGLSLILRSGEERVDGVDEVAWRTILGVVEQSTVQLKETGKWRGSVVDLHMVVGKVGVWAEWRLWRVVDGVVSLCQG